MLLLLLPLLIRTCLVLLQLMSLLLLPRELRR
jgi:hypothetical protein